MAAATQQLTNRAPQWQFPASPTMPSTHRTSPEQRSSSPAAQEETFEEIRQKLALSRKNFLNLHPESLASHSKHTNTDPHKPEPLTKKPPKKISFKIRKNASIYRRKEAKQINVVQELARKYNELTEHQLQASAEKVQKLIKRANSQLLKRRPSNSAKEPPSADRSAAAAAQANNVRAAIAIFEQKCIGKTQVKLNSDEKPKIPAKTFDVKAIAMRNQEKRQRLRQKHTPTDGATADLCKNNAKQNNGVTIPVSAESALAMAASEDWQVVSLPMATLKRCESNYECQKFGRYGYPRTIFSQTHQSEIKTKIAPEDTRITIVQEEKRCEEEEGEYDLVLPPVDESPLPLTPSSDELYECVPPLPPRTGKLAKIYETIKDTRLEVNSMVIDDDYEIPEVPEEKDTDGENVYESLSRSRVSGGKLGKQAEPLPPRPSEALEAADSNDEDSNYYESIYSKRDDNYETIYDGVGGEGRHCKRNSISVQSDHQTNSIYGRSITSWPEDAMDAYSGGSTGGSASVSGSCKAASELSGSSDDWVDISDQETDGKLRQRGKFVLVREHRHQKVCKKNSQQLRDQWNKVSRKRIEQGDTDSDHHYETLSSNNGRVNEHTHQLPAPQQQRNQLHHQQGHVEDDDDDFDSFDSDCESDNSFAKNDSGVDMGNTQLPEPPGSGHQTYAFTRFAASAGKNVMKRLRRNWSMRKNDISKSISKITKRKSRTDLDALDNDLVQSCNSSAMHAHEKHSKTMTRRGFLNKFKRSVSISSDIADNLTKSTFYLTETIDDRANKAHAEGEPEEVRKTCKLPTKPNLVRPQMPPPPTPNSKSRSLTWYAECGLFLGDQPAPALPRRPNSFWYAEVGLYQSGSPQGSTPSTSSAENSGNSGTVEQIKESDDEFTKNYYNSHSVKSYDSSDTKKDEAFNSLQGDIQLRLQDEPLYQFYDAAVLDSVCQDSVCSEYDEDYEEIEKGRRSSLGTNRPSAMELVAPHRNNVSVARTLWCEIPEVVHSTVLSTLSLHQKKLQEAKFEMLTSEASYLNSLHILTDYFVRRLQDSDLLNEEDKMILCGKIQPVKQCSEKLLLDLEKCWQENILLHGVCDIVKRHAELNFSVYVSYCENQIVLDQTLKRLKERPIFAEFLRQVESNTICQLLTLYSFLMLPMQRITRWPLLVDAILKRLSPQDDEYLSCQYALATLNKIVSQCNEGARNMERVTEMKRIAGQMEFAKGVPTFEVANGQRWLVRSGNLTQMINRGDDVKHTFGKRFSKLPVHLFLFNDIFVVAKSKGEGSFIVQHYCSRSYLELNGESLAMLPAKDAQGRHLIFVTMLENHEEKTVEMLLACSSESDRERWLEALSPPKSENPDETLYECWDCPQVTVMHNYTANQPDELALTRGDVINVTRKMADGWYHGERIRDGETGWFPANYTQEVANPHVRARNLKQRYRLLAFSENYLKSK